MLERQQFFKSFLIASVQTPPPLRKNPEGRGVCTQPNFRLLHITLRGETEKSQRGDLNLKYPAT